MDKLHKYIFLLLIVFFSNYAYAGPLSWLLKKGAKESTEEVGEYALRKGAKSAAKEGMESIAESLIRQRAKTLVKNYSRRALYRNQLHSLSRLGKSELDAAEFILKRPNKINIEPVDHINSLRISKLSNYKERIPYSDPSQRPPYTKGQINKVWENAKKPDGNVYDPNTGEMLQWDRSKSRAGQWDMGHVPGKEYSKIHKDYMDKRISLEELKKSQQDPNNFQPESPSANRSHRFEDK